MGKSKKKRGGSQVYAPTFLRKWRKDRRLTQEQLAAAANTTGATISRLEKSLQPYSQPMLEALAKVLGCTAGDLIDRPPGPGDKIAAILDDMSPENQRRAIAIIEALKGSEDVA